MNYEYENYCEPSEMDELFNEFQQKFKTLMLEDTNSRIGSIKHENEYLKKENKELKEALLTSEKSLKESKNILKDYSFMGIILNGIKDNIKTAEDKENKIYEFLDLIFKKDYKETPCFTMPIWIRAITQYYSNKDYVIEILKLFNIKLPENIENFRLPIDWNEEELDIFFDTIYNHVNCNGCTFDRNLEFWAKNSLDDVKTQCHRQYSEIPWQYVLRNPLLKKEKYLIEIGKNAYNSNGHSGNWANFYMIDKYLDLSEEEIKTILNNINETKLKKDDEIARFILRNLKYVENDKLLRKIYSLFNDSYDFKYNKKILEMPYTYILKWVCSNKNYAITFIEDNKDHFTEEQRKEMLTKAFDL